MLAARRTANVIGRIRFLISSIATKTNSMALGAPEGTIWARNSLTEINAQVVSIVTQIVNVNLKIRMIFLVGVGT